jgi:hypothetical protein
VEVICAGDEAKRARAQSRSAEMPRWGETGLSRSAGWSRRRSVGQGGSTMEAKRGRADLGDGAGEARQQRQGRDPVGKMAEVFYLNIPWLRWSRRRGSQQRTWQQRRSGPGSTNHGE